MMGPGAWLDASHLEVRGRRLSGVQPKGLFRTEVQSRRVVALHQYRELGV
jgi:hypothetical protein